MKKESLAVYERPEAEELKLVSESNFLQVSNEDPYDPGHEIQI